MDGATAPFSRDPSASRVKNINTNTSSYEPSFGTFVAHRQVVPFRLGRYDRAQDGVKDQEDGYGRHHDLR
jgi:hypothetical protein